MTTLIGSIRRVTAGHLKAVIVVVSLIGLAVLAGILSGLFGVGRTAQVMVTLVVPSSAMIIFWRAARVRVLDQQTEFETALELESVANRATAEFLVGVSHELTLHTERCSLRAEAIAVVDDYREVSHELKVAVPDIAIVTDPQILRQILHVLVGNALRHGGHRVAIWSAPGEESVLLTVSDDGPGLPPELGDHVFDRYVDLAEKARTIGSSTTGLTLARALSELIGGRMSHKRDPSWTHFSVRLPLGTVGARPLLDRVPLEAGVR